MTKEPERREQPSPEREVNPDDLEGQDVTELPNREAMTLITGGSNLPPTLVPPDSDMPIDPNPGPHFLRP